MEYRPSVTTTAGSRTSSWRRRNGAQAAISSGCGSRLPGGRHFTTLVMNTSSRCQPMLPRSRTSSPPARPTNGRPSRSSFMPGPSPTNTTSVSGSPSPGTARVRPSWSRQPVQSRTSFAICSSASRRSRRLTRFVPRTHATARRSLRLADPAALDERLRDLHGVGRRALAQVVRDHPERQAPVVRDRRVLAHPADEDLVGARGLGRQRVDVRRRVVLDHDALDGREQLARTVRRDRVTGLHVDRLGVADEHRDADGRAGDAQVRQVQDLAALGDDLPLLLRVPVVQEHVDVGEGVEADHVRVDVGDLGRGPRHAP